MYGLHATTGYGKITPNFTGPVAMSTSFDPCYDTEVKRSTVKVIGHHPTVITFYKRAKLKHIK